MRKWILSAAPRLFVWLAAASIGLQSFSPAVAPWGT